MRILLPSDVADRLAAALRRAGAREVGGVLMGEHVDEDEFRIVNFTLQTRGGTFASFLRHIEDFAAPLQRFFERTRHEYTRFNYLGEWHSHHAFALVPSTTDGRAMRRIVEDPASNVNFAVLLLVRLDAHGELEARATLHVPRHDFLPAEVIVLERGRDA